MGWFEAGNRLRKSGGNTLSSGLTFSLPLDNSGASQVPDTLMDGDGYSIDLAWLYRGQDASTSGWTDHTGNVTTDLSYAGSDPAPLFNQNAPVVDGGQAVLMSNAGRLFEGDTNDSNHQIDSDFVFFAMVNGGPDTNGLKLICNNGSTDSTTDQGWLLKDVTNSTVWFTVGDGTNRCRISPSPSGWAEGGWVLLTVCGDLDETTASYSLRGALNLDDVDQGLDTALGSLTNPINSSSSFEISNSSQGVAFAGMFKSPDVFPGGAGNATVMDAMIKNLASKILGVQASGQGTLEPSIATRNTAAYLPVVNSSGQERQHYVSQDWPRVGSVLAADGITEVKGYLGESSRTQVLTETETLQGANWAYSLAAVSDGYQDTVTAPIVGANVALFHATPGTGVHSVTQTFSSTSGVNSVYVKQYPGASRDSIVLDNRTANSDGVVFDFTTLTATVSGSAPGFGATPVGNGWWRIWARGTVDQLQILSGNHAQATIEPLYYLCAPQSENTSRLPTSYIPNTAGSGTVTRVVDALRYTMDDGNLPAPETAFTVDWSVQNIDHDSAANLTHFTLSDGGSANDRIVARTTNADDVISLFAASTEGASSNYTFAGDISDGYQHTLRFGSIGTSQTLRNLDTGATDSDTETMPNDVDRLDLCANRAGGENLNGLVSNLKLYSKGKGVE